MKSLIAAAALSFTLAGPAFAFQCPSDIAKIDAALETANLTDEQKAQVMELRDEGEQLHSSGQHQASVDTLAQAKEILGIN
jgi:Spy/CpxP family protein refolding chaperone